MTLQTYTTKISTKSVNIKAKKDTASHIASALRSPFSVRSSWRELTGIIGQTEWPNKETSRELTCMFGTGEGKIVNPEKYEADCTAYLASLPDLMTEETAGPFVEAARAIYAEHLPVVDKRQTKEQADEKAIEYQKQVVESNQRKAAEKDKWAAKYCESSEPIETPAGKQPVILAMNYDDSDSMTDYFDRHCQHGPAMLLGFVDKGTRQSEATIRRFVEMYPDLAALKWTWHKENYSMGHGYWLESNVIGNAENVKTYGGVENPETWWEIRFGWGFEKSHLPYKGYGHKPAKQEEPKQEETKQEETSAAYTLTQERDWTWIKFASKPAENVLTSLKSAGGRFSGKRSAWYFTKHMTAAEIGL